MSVSNFPEVTERAHHIRKNISGSRAKYREGRRHTSVKVYTVSQESNYLLIQGVPAVGVRNELISECEQYGEVHVQPLDEYPCEEFTEVYLAKYSWFPAARTAKKHLDDKSFFGGNLHVCYAPEFETVAETSQKLQERRKYVSMQTKQGEKAVNPVPVKYHNLGQSRNPAIESSSLHYCGSGNLKAAEISNVNCVPAAACYEPTTYIWGGKEYTVYPQSDSGSSSNNVQSEVTERKTANNFLPRPLLKASETLVNVRKKSWNESMTNITDDSYSEEKLVPATNAAIRSKLANLSVPNTKVSFKRRKVI